MSIQSTAFLCGAKRRGTAIRGGRIFSVAQVNT
jgi:hypothetical protein